MLSVEFNVDIVYAIQTRRRIPSSLYLSSCLTIKNFLKTNEEINCNNLTIEFGSREIFKKRKLKIIIKKIELPF